MAHIIKNFKTLFITCVLYFVVISCSEQASFSSSSFVKEGTIYLDELRNKFNNNFSWAEYAQDHIVTKDEMINFYGHALYSFQDIDGFEANYSGLEIAEMIKDDNQMKLDIGACNVNVQSTIPSTQYHLSLHPSKYNLFIELRSINTPSEAFCVTLEQIELPEPLTESEILEYLIASFQWSEYAGDKIVTSNEMNTFSENYIFAPIDLPGYQISYSEAQMADSSLFSNEIPLTLAKSPCSQELLLLPPKPIWAQENSEQKHVFYLQINPLFPSDEIYCATTETIAMPYPKIEEEKVEQMEAPAVEAEAAESAPIEDLIPPEDLNIAINSGAKFTSLEEVKVNIGTNSGDFVALFNGQTCQGEANWQAMVSVLTWTIPPDASGLVSISAKSKDLAGNESNCVKASINHTKTFYSTFKVDSVASYRNVAVQWTQSPEIAALNLTHQIAIGTTPGSNDVLDWTDVGENTNYPVPPLAYIKDKKYYPTIKSSYNGESLLQKNLDGFTVSPDYRSISSAKGGTGQHNCIITADQKLRCWGGNYSGQLGIETNIRHGYDANTMGPNLPYVNLGNNVKPISVNAFEKNTCILGDDFKVRCWGESKHLNGHGTGTDNYGRDSGTMGNNLPIINLGTNLKVVKLGRGDGWHACALFEMGKIKCWGQNYNGQLGYEDLLNRGDTPETMGENLPFVDLGDEYAIDIATGSVASCAILQSGRVKCWGNNNYGRLGLNDKVNRGGAPNEMGKNLPYLNFGDNLKATELSMGWGAACAVFENGTAKCWGHGGDQVTGQNINTAISDGVGPSLDSIPAINFGWNKPIKHIDTGSNHNCLMFDDGSIKCIGWNCSFENGYGLSSCDHAATVAEIPAVNLGSSIPFQMSIGYSWSCVYLESNDIKCWGANYNGSLGHPGIGILGKDTDMGDSLPALDLTPPN